MSVDTPKNCPGCTAAGYRATTPPPNPLPPPGFPPLSLCRSTGRANGGRTGNLSWGQLEAYHQPNAPCQQNVSAPCQRTSHTLPLNGQCIHAVGERTCGFLIIVEVVGRYVLRARISVRWPERRHQKPANHLPQKTGVHASTRRRGFCSAFDIVLAYLLFDCAWTRTVSMLACGAEATSTTCGAESESGQSQAAHLSSRPSWLSRCSCTATSACSKSAPRAGFVRKTSLVL